VLILKRKKFEQNWLQELKNGVDLCKLVNLIRPGSVIKYFENPKNSEEEIKNLESFRISGKAFGVTADFSEQKFHDGKYGNFQAFFI